jgi:hypothetical protein
LLRNGRWRPAALLAREPLLEPLRGGRQNQRNADHADQGRAQGARAEMAEDMAVFARHRGSAVRMKSGCGASRRHRLDPLILRQKCQSGDVCLVTRHRFLDTCGDGAIVQLNQ